jgi:hypothetical protein
MFFKDCSTVEHTEIDSVQVPKEVTFLNNRNIVAIAKTNQNVIETDSLLLTKVDLYKKVFFP